MKCITCKTVMKCVTDANGDIRFDYEECPKCGSKAEIIWSNDGEYIKKVIWER